jgi:lipoprotein-anchoring transpeptidase ErfK/SrfK
MMWRAAFVAAAALSTIEAAPASAQFYGGWEGYNQRPFWEQRRGRDWRNQDRYDQDDWGYDDEDGYYRGQPIIRSGGERPAIAPVAPPKVAFHGNFVPNSIVINTAGRKLYYILSATEAYEYPISVGRQGFSWTGTEVISRKQEWPDWHPPKEMIARDARLPDKMTGGLKNPLGALALYLGNTLYRIHGTNDPKTIGQAASSGCFRMMNEHVLHLASIANIGTAVTVVKQLPTQVVSSAPAAPPPAVRPEPQDEPYARDPSEEPDDDDRYDDPRNAPRGYDRYEPYDRFGDPL